MRKNSQKNISGFAQIAQKKLRKTAQNSLRFMRKNCAKVRKKKFCAKIAQILRKKYSHFVETLVRSEVSRKRYIAIQGEEDGGYFLNSYIFATQCRIT